MKEEKSNKEKLGEFIEWWADDASPHVRVLTVLGILLAVIGFVVLMCVLVSPWFWAWFLVAAVVIFFLIGLYVWLYEVLE